MQNDIPLAILTFLVLLGVILLYDISFNLRRLTRSIKENTRKLEERA